MKLNHFLWNNYIESEKGKACIEFFKNHERHHINQTEELKTFLKSREEGKTVQQHKYNPDDKIKENLGALKELRGYVSEGLLPKAVNNQKEAEEYFLETDGFYEPEEGKDESECGATFDCTDIPRLSVALYMLHPNYFFPYYFMFDYPLLQKTFDEFGIFLPPAPKKTDGHGRYLHYLELCVALHDYWQPLGFNPEHIPVFLYGFAPEIVEPQKRAPWPLPAPKRAWFVGAGVDDNGDAKYLDELTPETESPWHGNVDTEPGDIVVIYCVGPRSEIHSIWRAIKHGHVEPFFYFYGAIDISYGQLLKPIKFSELQKDPVMAEFGLVKACMQGVGGTNIPKNIYDRILHLLNKKGMDTSRLPQLLHLEPVKAKLKVEADVEKHVLEPLLLQLGFSETNWTRQVTLRVGTAEKVIPDYLINCKRAAKSHVVVADWVWEAKHTIKTKKQLEIDFGQACSYAKLVNAKGVSLISKDGLWMSTKEDDYLFAKARHWPSSQFHELKTINEIRAIAGTKKLLAKIRL